MSQDKVHSEWLVPEWPAPPGVHALCTTRAGGVSQPPYDSLNLGTHVGDEPAAVLANRQVLQSALQAKTAGARAVFLNQVHADGVVCLDTRRADGAEADACVATAPGPVCTIMVADCLPVLLAHRSGKVVAAAHAGWRGLAGTQGRGVLESVFAQFSALAVHQPSQTRVTSRPQAGGGTGCVVAQDTFAWLGPCIGPRAFEVGPEVREAFCDADPAAADCFGKASDTLGKYFCDLAGLARMRLRGMGITHVYGNDSTPAWCTVANASRFFSHRRDSAARGGSGRFAACIWLG